MQDITLILNTAEKRIQFLLCRGDSVLCAEDWLAQRGGTELLAPALREACARLDAPPSELSRIACVAGPGNFTGLRIGLTTASGLARAVGAKQAGLDYLQCLALNAQARSGEEVLVMTNARRGLAYCARFLVDEGGAPRPQGRTFLLPLPPVPEGIELGTPDFVLGSALSSNRDYLRGLFPSSTCLLPASADQPTTASLFAAQELVKWDEADGSDPAPLYLRDCDAVENFESIARAQGRDPKRAQQELQRLMTAGLEETD
ncbi:MAG: tRNA (adenosine(37)-N6)-threonylcarbamoyltransferase complex dimerization subunit type 1 TsaB [Mailhella sp.]|nr:tRNA (adenosine(37)-N6)-threonylcarbamoyltransferase complex dimerization subunit type 1 TsaB [Mailhella sp.]